MNSIERLTWWIWEASLTASWAMLIALPLLLVFRKPAFAQARYWIGLLVIARLLFPISFQSELSVQTYVPAAAAAAEVIHEAPVYLDATSPEPTRIFPLVWLTGALLLTARVVVQQWRVRGWIRAGELVTLPALDVARQLMPTRRKIAVYVVPQITTPALCGWFRPKLLLPPNVLANENLRMIFLHELAHVRRWDVLAKWAMIAARTLHWFNPLVWLITRRMEADQELLCDVAALRALNRDDQKRYGETLLALASDTRPASATLLPISGNFKQMKERIGMITHFKPAPRRSVLLAAAVAAVFSFLAFTRAVDKPAVAPGAAERTAAPKAKPVRIELLREEFARLTAQIQQKEEELDKIRATIDLTGPLKDEDTIPRSEVISLIEHRMTTAQADRDRVEEILENLKGKGQEHARKVLPTIHPDGKLDDLLSELSSADKDLAQALEQYSEKHPEVLRRKTLVKKLDQQIAERIEELKAGLEASAKSNQNALRRMEEQIHRAKSRDADLRRNARPYFNLKRDIETMRQVRDSLHARLLQEEIESRVAKAGE